MKPLSSRKTTLLPARRAFFYMGPAFCPPFPNAVLVSLPGSPLRFLTTPSLSTQNLPDVSGVVANCKGTSDDFGHAAQGPELRGISVRGGPFEQELQKSCSLASTQQSWPTGCGLRP